MQERTEYGSVGMSGVNGVDYKTAGDRRWKKHY